MNLDDNCSFNKLYNTVIYLNLHVYDFDFEFSLFIYHDLT